ncbi:MAG: hypothetical protein J3K34DRAFT_404001 [Monoraphidium minutum]|nr:MAG: hypothetical protein J3K34DRAFT_404001 [Monoraphidium minutum]
MLRTSHLAAPHARAKLGASACRPAAHTRVAAAAHRQGDHPACSASGRDAHASSSGSDAGASGSASAGSGTGRRALLLRGSLAPLAVQLTIGSDDTTTIVNSVLSAYGLPTLKASPGYKLWDEFADEYTFEYPRAWVARPNSLRKGVYISDFQTADKVSVEVLDAPPDGDVAKAAVTAAVLPGGGRLTQDDLLTLPAMSQVDVSSETVDGQDITYLEFVSETITRSGYQIRRRNFAAGAVKRGKLYIISASARSDQYNDAKRETLRRTVRSFRLR